MDLIIALFSMAMFPIFFFAIAVVISGLRVINQYERGVLFTLGKFSGIKQPGLTWILAIFGIQRLVRVDIRTKVIDVPDQDAITKDNISVKINAVIYYRISDAAKAIIEIENYQSAVSQLAQTTMRNTSGEATLDQLLANRDEISDRIKQIVDAVTVNWGVEVANVELKDITVPADMQRTMAKQAEAERERRAVIIQSEGEVSASANMAKAAKTLAEVPGALHLRTLQAINDMSSDQSNTVVFMLPVEVLRALEGFGKK